MGFTVQTEAPPLREDATGALRVGKSRVLLEHMNISPTALALLVASGTLAGVVLTSLFNLINTRMAKKSEERKHQRDLIINTALESRRQAIELAKRSHAPQVFVLPLDDFIIHMVALSEIVLDKKLDKATLAARMSELNEFVALRHAERTRIQLKNRA